MLGMWGGAILGTFFLDIDHLLYWFVTHPEKEDSGEAREICGRIKGTRGIRKTREVAGELYGLLKQAHFTHTRLIFHSAVGQAVLLILAVYILTSGGSIFGSAFIMSINLHLLKDEWSDFRGRKEYLVDWLFWQVSDSGIKKHIREYLVGASLIFLLLTAFLVSGS